MRMETNSLLTRPPIIVTIPIQARRDRSQNHILDTILILSGNSLEVAAVGSVTLDTNTTKDTRRTI